MTNEDTRRDWEPVQEDVGISKTDRLRVQTGWLYRTTFYDVRGTLAVAMVFVPGRTAE